MELSDIKKVRKFLGLSQQDLAIQSGVSQSLIAKIESGLVDPTYTKTKKIFDTLTNLREKKQTKAQEIMNTSIIFTSPDDKVRNVITLMKERGISQLPVTNNEKVIGLITERSIIENISEQNIEERLVEEVMEECPPIISPQTNYTLLIALLTEHPFLIIAEKGVMKGIISRTDVLEKIR